jgi:hypothetical protein
VGTVSLRLLLWGQFYRQPVSATLSLPYWHRRRFSIRQWFPPGGEVLDWQGNLDDVRANAILACRGARQGGDWGKRGCPCFGFWGSVLVSTEAVYALKGDNRCAIRV